ncbi:MerR family transcriptional regulator [Nucisporomicrobium flavum]|jgi:DNA-binding transcriptional MerR regulator|uniref:MerR family transcriptional regulator n=1 Tax=Nucisporomicrobium flavum TaxID=2785915 RepID=UPI0018F2A833|nr:MerR family transcriptional regulator [Nucisporomicrobium flavum]
MTTAERPRLSIGDVSERTGLTRHTLRFYEQEGLFVEPVSRDSAGRRVFTEQEVGWLLVCARLRASGMPLPDIRRYADLVRQGPGTEHERLAILQEHRERVRAQVAELHEALEVIDDKVALYEKRLAEGTADELWRNGPECDNL